MPIENRKSRRLEPEARSQENRWASQPSPALDNDGWGGPQKELHRFKIACLYRVGSLWAARVPSCRGAQPSTAGEGLLRDRCSLAIGVGDRHHVRFGIPHPENVQKARKNPISC